MAGSYLLFEIETQGLRDLAGRFQKADKQTKEILRDTMRGLGEQYVKFLRQEAPSDTGSLRRGITYKTQETGTVTELRITSARSYTQYVLHGTPARGAGKGPPISALQGWADRHGINVWKVWWSIKREGTSVWSLRKYGEKANRFQKRAEELMGPEYTKAARSIAGHVRDYLVGI